MPMQLKTAPARALNVILHGLSGTTNPDVLILDYQCEKTFHDLWLNGLESSTPQITGQDYDWNQPGQQILIIGNDAPSAAFDFLKRPGMPLVDVQQHFSACSWAAVFRLLHPQTSINVVIIEAGQRASMRGTGVDLLSVFTNQGKDNHAVVPGVTVLCSPHLDEIVAAVQKPQPQKLTVGQMGVLKGIIQEHLLPNAENQHKMGNVVGALMLDPQQGSGVRILGSLFRALQPDTKFEATEPQVVSPVDEALATHLKNGPHFILFDDMGLLWKPFLSRWIPDSRLHIAEVTQKSMTHLTNRIKSLAAEPIQKRRLKASDFGVTTLADDESFVLLLDLRLFAGDQRNEEADFVYQLKQAAEDVARAAHLKWPVISANEIQKGIQAWYEKQPFSPAFRKTRSWLPRLISLIDPTLPIIVFSSTQDPDVLKEFQPYGNIITEFAKPMFRGVLGETKEWASAATLTFEKALRTARNIFLARSSVQVICESAFVSENQRDGELDGAVNNVSKSLVEIFIDESGTPSEENFAVGGFVLISGAKPFNHELFRTLALARSDVGLWGIDDVFRYTATEDFPDNAFRLPKGEMLFDGAQYSESWLDERLANIESLVASQDAEVIACSLRSMQKPNLMNTISPIHPFHRYRILLAHLLEAILLHCEPVRAALESGATIAVDAATAAHVYGNAKELQRRFGAFSFENKRCDEMCMTLDRSDVLPILADVLSRNNLTGKYGGRIKRARATKLLDWGKCEREGEVGGGSHDLDAPKQLHYLADWVAHIARSNEDRMRLANMPILKNWYLKGFGQVDSDDFRAQLRSHRKWLQGAKVDAIRLWKKSSQGDEFLLTPRMSRASANWIESLSADDLTTLFHST